MVVCPDLQEKQRLLCCEVPLFLKKRSYFVKSWYLLHAPTELYGLNGLSSTQSVCTHVLMTIIIIIALILFSARACNSTIETSH